MASADQRERQAAASLRQLHSRVVSALSPEGRDIFRKDVWQSELGEGLSAVVEREGLWDRAFAGFSDVGGDSLPVAASSRHPELEGQSWRAVGVSVVVHPESPLIPSSHMNLRFFSTASGRWWFGGGFDLSPCYPEPEDCRLWHSAARDAVRDFGEGLYEEFKQACDRYFYLPHRGEMRGIGGLFFDDFARLPFDESLAMAESVGAHFLTAYAALIHKYRDLPFTQEQKDFQLYRRGRYAEFNLALDRGTRFGLQAGGRIESILASLPPTAHWRYDYRPSPGTAEARLADFLRPQDWLRGR